jgi:chromosome segregation ATPase
VSGIASFIESLKKNRIVLEEHLQATTTEIASLQAQIDTLLQHAAYVQENWNDKQATEEALDREIATLEGELAGEKRVKTRLETSLEEQEQKAKESKEKRISLETTIPTKEKTLEEIEDALRSKATELRNIESEIAKQQVKLDNLDSEQTEKFTKLSEEITEEQDKVSVLNARYKALAFLLKEQIISSPEAKVIAELKGKESTSVDFLTKTTFIGRFRVVEILDKMAKREIISFDRKTGQVNVIKPIHL